MRVFQGLEPSATPECLVDSVRAVTSHLDRLSAPRSLCEIGLDGDDYEWLCRWARRQNPSRVRRSLEGLHSILIALTVNRDNLTYAEAMGCMFLLLASEVGRREATEGSLWPSVRRHFPLRCRERSICPRPASRLAQGRDGNIREEAKSSPRIRTRWYSRVLCQCLSPIRLYKESYGQDSPLAGGAGDIRVCAVPLRCWARRTAE